MASETVHTSYRDPLIWRACEEMGERDVLSALGSADGAFVNFKQRQHAWAWVFEQRLKTRQHRSQAVISVTRWACLLAMGGFLEILVFAIGTLR